MGLCLSYMSNPDTEKYSSDESNAKLNCGTSSMQGWRDSQQDAHNCIIDYDTDTSYFAVYDGHGGDEVALYCSEQLPEFLKELDDYKNGNIEKALEEAFLQFDGSLTKKKIFDKLQKLRDAASEKRRKERRRKDKQSEEEEEEDVDNLCQEAAMPIEELILKYQSGELYKDIAARIQKKASTSNSSATDSSSTANEPETSGEVVSTSSCIKTDSTIKSDSTNDKKPDSTESKSIETKEADHSSPVVETKVDSPDSSADAREVCTPSDKTTDKDSLNQNGEVESTQDCESSKPDVSSSSATPHENGEVVKKGKGKAVTKTKGVVPKTPPSQRPKRSAKVLYNSILNMEECSEEESEDEKDETFQGPNDESSDDDEEEVASAESSEESTADEEEDSEEGEDDDAVDYDERDSEFLENMKQGPGLDSGTTAVVALLKENELYVANAGDSRCVVCRNGKALEMSFDHKPEDKIEYDRIDKAGGYVNLEGRVNGGLNLSRAIGDHAYKQNKELTDREQSITALPDVKTLTLKPDEDEFMILACDGIWNSMSSQEVVDFVRTRIQEGREKLSMICEEMFDHCLAPSTFCDGQGCDNMTALIVQFKGKNFLKKPLSDPEESGRSKRMKLDEEASA